MHQHLKFSENSIKNVSNYCPLDLYSRNPQRIRKALLEIFENPQNNLKLYFNGDLIFGIPSDSNGTYMEKITNILTPSLFTSRPLESLVNILSKILIDDEILLKLKKVQELDTLDIEAIYYLYSILFPSHQDLKSDIAKQIFEESELEYKDSLLKFISNLSEDEIQDKIGEYLISSTIKDCSIMITLAPIK
jgi:inositol-pentakisphosphate 2-kinase